MDGIKLLRCICNDARFEILFLLEKNSEMCVNDFVKIMKKDQPLVSHHLKILRQCGIVKSEPCGQKMMYRISNSELRELVASVTRASREIPSMCGDGPNCC